MDFSEELERVVLALGALLANEVDVTKLRMANILTISGTCKTSLPTFLALVLATSEGKIPSTISN